MINRHHWNCVGLLVALVAVAVVRLAAWQGLWRPVRISGGSMAETLAGEHFAVACHDCRFPCRYDAQAPPRDQRVVCPNCGFVNDHSADGPMHGGRRVLIDRLAYAWRPPDRWDVVAFRTPGNEPWLSVKRVVGLPGERVEFREGDLVIDGRHVRKSLEQLRTLAVLVHDDAYRPEREADLPPRWQSESGTCGWCVRDRGYEFQPSPEPTEALQWLTYRHWPCFSGSVARTQLSPILDNYGYNQQVSRQLNVVWDVMLSCRLKTPGRTGRLAFEVSDRDVCHRVELRFDRREIVLARGSRQPVSLDLPYAAFARGVEIEMALCDGQVMFGIDRQELIRECYESSALADSPGDPPPSRVAIGAAGLTAAVDRLRVLRDVYYLPSAAPVRIGQEPTSLGEGELYVVGDNVPISQDSRHWQRPGLPVENLLGRVCVGR